MRNNKVEDSRIAIVVCSTVHTKSLFKKIHARYLESASVQWYVFTTNDTITYSMDYIREGTQCGWWMWNNTSVFTNISKIPLNRPETDRDFKGRELTVTITDNGPRWDLQYLNDGRIIPVSGIDYNFLKTVGEKLNFTIRVKLTPDGQWGNLHEDGTVTGMIGVVHRHEAHMAMNEITINEDRERVIDFAYPYYTESIVMISPAPAKKQKFYAVVTPFTVK
ncbi:hypothetical protein SK128_017723, partial [Halocaridina rubra]